MDGAFQWLNALIEWLAQFFPRWQVVPETEAGVYFVRGKAKPIQPGSVAVWWPFWTECEYRPIVRQTLSLDAQSLMSGDGKPIVAAAVVVYEIKDVVKCITKVHDIDEALGDISKATVKHAVWGMTLGEMMDQAKGMDGQLKRDLAKKVRGWGIKVHTVFLSDLSTCAVVRHLGEGALVAMPEEE